GTAGEPAIVGRLCSASSTLGQSTRLSRAGRLADNRADVTPPPIDMRLHPLALATFLLAAAPAVVPAQATDVYYPDAGSWERRAASQVGMNEARLAEAVMFVQSAENPAPRDLAIAHYLTWGREPMDAALG